MDMNEELLKISSCKLCARMVMALCSEHIADDCEEVFSELTEICGKIGYGGLCGTLAACIAALYVNDSPEKAAVSQDEFMEWFCSRYGGYDCEEIIGGDHDKKMSLCPQIVGESYSKIKEYIALSA